MAFILHKLLFRINMGYISPVKETKFILENLLESQNEIESETIDAVLEDVRLERYSLVKARDLYRVVLFKRDGSLFVDEVATSKSRSKMKRSS